MIYWKLWRTKLDQFTQSGQYAEAVMTNAKHDTTKGSQHYSKIQWYTRQNYEAWHACRRGQSRLKCHKTARYINNKENGKKEENSQNQIWKGCTQTWQTLSKLYMQTYENTINDIVSYSVALEEEMYNMNIK